VPVILGDPGRELRRSLASVLSSALERGAPRPELIVAQGVDDIWLHRLFEQPRAARSRGVLVARNEQGLAAAVRAGVGGALWAPPATPALVTALEAAASTGDVSRTPALSLEDTEALVTGSAEAWAIVRVGGHGLWHRRCGTEEIRQLLGTVVGRLGAGYLLAVGPALLVQAERVADAVAAWAKVTEGSSTAGADDLVATPLPVAADEEVVLWACGAAPGGASPADGRRQAIIRPVYEIPSGRRLGWWSTGPRAQPAPDGWLAVPETGSGGVHGWRLGNVVDEPASVPEVVCTADIRAGHGVASVRVPGWVAADLRSGTPGALLVEHLACAADTIRVPLWVPNVRSSGLRFLLGIGAVMWVDGPAVPTGSQ
jgi:hypothetical protein